MEKSTMKRKDFHDSTALMRLDKQFEAMPPDSARRIAFFLFDKYGEERQIEHEKTTEEAEPHPPAGQVEFGEGW